MTHNTAIILKDLLQDLQEFTLTVGPGQPASPLFPVSPEGPTVPWWTEIQITDQDIKSLRTAPCELLVSVGTLGKFSGFRLYKAHSDHYKLLSGIWLSVLRSFFFLEQIISCYTMYRNMLPYITLQLTLHPGNPQSPSGPFAPWNNKSIH